MALAESEKLFKDNYTSLNNGKNSILIRKYEAEFLLSLFRREVQGIIEKKEIVEALTSVGLKIGVNTLKKWEDAGAIDEAEFRDSRKTVYPKHVLLEVYANCMLRDKHRIKDKSDLAEIRGWAYKIMQQEIDGTYWEPTRYVNEEGEKRIRFGKKREEMEPEEDLAHLWLFHIMKGQKLLFKE